MTACIDPGPPSVLATALTVTGSMVAIIALVVLISALVD